MLPLLFIILIHQYCAKAQGPEGYFNGSSYVSLQSTLSIRGRTSFSFRTCSNGQLVFQDSSFGDFIDLSLLPTGQLEMMWQVNRHRDSVRVGSNLINNHWHDVDLIHSLGSATLSVGRESVLVANSTHQQQLFSIQFDRFHPLIIGRGFSGCILQGAGVVLNASSAQSFGVRWEKCPLPNRGDCDGYQVDFCFSQPCHKYSKCVSLLDGYQCLCTTRYTGRNCEIDQGPLCGMPEYHQCQNGGECREDKTGNFTFCVCPSNFTGTFCETMIDSSFCDTQPCRHGGTCNINQFRDNYICICPEGFAGVDCELNIDECQSSPCQNNGSCTVEINSYTCDCSGTGYRGSNCEENINECEDNNPCYTGSTCFDRYGDYICECPPGFGSKNCDQEVNECDSNPCQNGGSCNDDLNGFLCHCSVGFAGIYCEENIDDCIEVSCPNNSFCVDGINSFSCACNPGFSGAVPHCLEINECLSEPCLNGGTCQDRLNSYTCHCPNGFSGNQCDININECLPDPCSHGATCVDGIGRYICECLPGYSGINCDVDINECASNPCRNSIRCIDLVNDYSCQCLPGWEGKNCIDKIDECSSQPCMHGQCVDLFNNFTCSCDLGYTGKLCNENINDCLSNPCMNGGTCTDLIADFICNCQTDFMGKNCSELYDACHMTPCENGGTCLTNSPSHNYTCICPSGFQGSQCEVNIDECEGIVCPTGQVCFDLQNSYKCGCPTGFTGSDCSININECSSNPCVNGTCVDGIGNYACQCPSGLTGRHCEDDINECQESPCVHGICQNFQGSFLCYCRPGFTGIRCDIEFNECLSAPCKNNATCNDLINDYNCSCLPGFSGRNCETNVDECESNPCQNGATCTDKINRYECHCLPGFTGTNCEINIDECASLPCQNSGSCLDGINGFDCNCSDTGFSGAYCEININDCESAPCQNGAACKDGIKDYYCDCYNGYGGKNCENDIPECSYAPCQNSALCLENSNETLYEMNYLGLFPTFSYASAGGYQCICSLGFTGVNCETNIDDCEVNDCDKGKCIDGINSYHCECNPGFEGRNCSIEINECERFSPCENGALCSDLVADYWCDCLPEYGDKNCSTLLIGCRGERCQNGATCYPYLSEIGDHVYNCSCPQGFNGEYCEVPTTVSFNGTGYWQTIPQSLFIENYNLQLSFRTTLPNGLIVQGIISHQSLEYILYLWQGMVCLDVYNNSGRIVELFSTNGQNDSHWKYVHVEFKPYVVTLNVSGLVNQAPVVLSGVNFMTQLGAPSEQFSPAKHYMNKAVPNFTGCIQDVWVNDEIMIPDLASSPIYGATIGCPRKDQCGDSPCATGRCEDMWLTYHCICYRPHFGEKCQYSHIPATFGFKDQKSYAELFIPSQRSMEFSDVTDVSLFIRTRKETGLIFYLGLPITDQNVYARTDTQNETFLVARLENGRLQILLKLNSGYPIVLNIDQRMNDGNYYYIQVTKNSTHLTAKVNESFVTKTIPAGILHVSVLYIAGLPAVNRQKRQIASRPFSDDIYSYSYENITFFKGIIQDFRLNNMVVEFYSLNISNGKARSFFPRIIGTALLNSIEKGVVSDNLCEPIDPCQNGATCNDTWNDYICHCPEGYRGKNCEELEPCSFNTCPYGSTCRNLEVGYECVVAAAFNGVNSAIQYEVQDFPYSIANITFAFRSINNGTILKIESTSYQKYFLHVELLRDSLEVSWNLGPSESNVHTLLKIVSVPLEVDDGKWHNVTILFEGNLVTLSLEGRNQLSEDNYRVGLSELINGGANIYVAHDPYDGKFFKGCLDEVRIGGILLPFFWLTDLDNTTSPFNATKLENVNIGCILCWDDDCIHGSCKNKKENFDCHCDGGYEGPLCNIDICVDRNPCQHGGTCIHENEDIKCRCTEQYTGFNCSVENKCVSNPCRNGGTCSLLEYEYVCNCTNNFEGRNCDKRKILDCSSDPCVHGNCSSVTDKFNRLMQYKCSCFEGYEGQNCDTMKDFCISNPCQNHGTCTLDVHNANYKCQCPPGFTDKNCQTNIDDCKTEPCLHGDCIDGNNSYICHCYPGYIGSLCEIRIRHCIGEKNPCYNGGTCDDTKDGYKCTCSPGFFGNHCSIRDECDDSKCKSRGTCIPGFDEKELNFEFNCTCIEGYTGKTCAEKITLADDGSLILIIITPVICIIILCLLIGAIIFLRVAKKKRATRGTYSPSRQEMFGSRVEMNHVMKPPPEERLI